MPEDHTVDGSVVSDWFMDGFVVFKLPALGGGVSSSTHMHKHNTNRTFCVASNAHTTVCCQENYSGMLLLRLYLTPSVQGISTVGSLENKTKQLDLYLRFVQESYVLGNNGSHLARRERGAQRQHSLASMLFGCFRPKCAVIDRRLSEGTQYQAVSKQFQPSDTCIWFFV